MATLEDLPREARDELALLARELSDSPETRKDFLRLAKMKRPDMPVPELDLEEGLRRVSQTSEEKIAALESKLAEKDMREELNKRRQKLGRSEEEVAAIEKIMLEKGIQNHDTAADYFDWMKQAAPSTPPAYSRNVFDQKTKTDLSSYWKNPVTAARDAAANALNEIRKNPKAVGY